MNRRTPSYEILREASMGPTQRQALADHPDNDNDARAYAPGSPELRKQAASSSEAEHRSLFRLLLLCAALFAAACVVVVALTDTTVAQLPQLLRDVASFRRTPCTAMDNAAAVSPPRRQLPCSRPPDARQPPAAAHATHATGDCDRHGNAAPRAHRLHGVLPIPLTRTRTLTLTLSNPNPDPNTHREQVCAACCPNPGARWFLLHALGNFVVAVR